LHDPADREQIEQFARRMIERSTATIRKTIPAIWARHGKSA
jgi:hypothetical protein